LDHQPAPNRRSSASRESEKLDVHEPDESEAQIFAETKQKKQSEKTTRSNKHHSANVRLGQGVSTWASDSRVRELSVQQRAGPTNLPTQERSESARVLPTRADFT
jgi:hypothetical protein